ncbi:MAG: valine--tRNA ligase, partial [Planctomycetota bacterium]
MEMETRFDPSRIEQSWYEYWEQEGVFGVDADPDATPYCIVIPPPNVTGALHMGHALNNVIQDVFIRRARMQGRATLWLPGTDHAGIATQNVMEKQLLTEGLRKEDLGRDKFVRRVWGWKDEYRGRIVGQLKRLGCSCDWSRERFTLDEGLSRAVREVFVRLYEKGLVYRDEALVNWCPRCRTTLSNEECPAVEEDGHYWDLRYPVVGEEGRFVVVSTTRPETMLGDTAVAVHPSDERYSDLVGRTVTLPLVLREIPVVADEHADPEKGSGAVKITPAHDFDDFEVGKRHDLDRVVVIDEEGRMSEAAGAYAGLDRFEARERVLEDLEAQGLTGDVEDKRIPLPRCYRCHTVVEPHLSTQWFVKMRPLLEPAAESVRGGRVRFVPDRYAKLYFEWVEKYIDWPISRQLWWGHRIPVYYCDGCGETIVARDEPGGCPACG